ncbi:MAG TPA: RluA family pseudouridine synthase [Armatimonadota bacterium]|jgi:23S rRNA pseudouridine1911/1915/1917 synthase|nr:RluA family pseudouridine synthase [Armatimonadota bacterium]HOQ28384.1 RluA family pseudouridine synthase [Armatimonadota bacterium]HPO71334.1 RluA family pseudouridine synthase [Armatimonadota bacterium]HPT97022.1 RluA family pseudouridine synthase [Armatimonadota bacterium]
MSTTPTAPPPSRRLVVMEEDAGTRIDQALASRYDDLTRSRIQKLIESGHITVNGAPTRASYPLRVGDRVCIAFPETTRPEGLLPEEIELDIVYEDEDLLVINKPVGMVVHPAVGSTRGTLVHALLAYPGALSSIAGEDRPGIVHRLDKDTSGLIMVARNDYAHNDLSRQIRERTAGRRYLALVWGNPRFDRVRVEVPIGRHPTDRKKMTVYPAGERRPPSARDATTDLTVLERFTLPCALLEAKLKTGRTHQIRVHCSYIGHPVMGDPQYGGQRKLPVRDLELEDLIERVEGQALHAYRLSFTHPRTGAPMEFTAPPPRPYLELLNYLRAHYPMEGSGPSPLVGLNW